MTRHAETAFFWGVDITYGGTTEGLSIGHLPTRKSLALYASKPGLSQVLAYFRSEEQAREAARFLRLLTGSTYVPGSAE